MSAAYILVGNGTVPILVFLTKGGVCMAKCGNVLITCVWVLGYWRSS